MKLRQKLTFHIILKLGDHENDHSSEDDVEYAQILFQFSSTKIEGSRQNINNVLPGGTFTREVSGQIMDNKSTITQPQEVQSQQHTCKDELEAGISVESLLVKHIRAANEG